MRNKMASTKEYRDFILEQLSEAPNINCRPMMGGFLLYSNNIFFGGIYDDCLLVKIVPKNKQYKMTEEIPYDGAKPMYFMVYGRCRQQRRVSRNSDYNRKRTNY